MSFVELLHWQTCHGPGCPFFHPSTFSSILSICCSLLLFGPDALSSRCSFTGGHSQKAEGTNSTLCRHIPQCTPPARSPQKAPLSSPKSSLAVSPIWRHLCDEDVSAGCNPEPWAYELLSTQLVDELKISKHRGKCAFEGCSSGVDNRALMDHVCNCGINFNAPLHRSAFESFRWLMFVWPNRNFAKVVRNREI